jgi:hypothetical protein
MSAENEWIDGLERFRSDRSKLSLSLSACGMGECLNVGGRRVGSLLSTGSEVVGGFFAESMRGKSIVWQALC